MRCLTMSKVSRHSLSKRHTWIDRNLQGPAALIHAQFEYGQSFTPEPLTYIVVQEDRHIPHVGWLILSHNSPPSSHEKFH